MVNISARNRHELRRLCAVDLFAGAGGFSEAAKESGIQVVAAIENNQNACKTYRANLVEKKPNPPKLFSDDITQLPVEKFIKSAGIEPGCIDVLMGGPPCQGFSTHRIKDAGVDDPRNALLLHYFSYLNALRPKAFVVENVPGLLWPRHERYLNKFYELAAEGGYEVLPPQVINAKDYGVPQNRKRVFILGFRDKVPYRLQWPPAPTHFAPESEEVLIEGLPAWRTASEVFSLPIDPDDPNSIHMNHTPEMVKVFESTPLNGGSRQQSGRILPCHRQHNGHKDVYGRIDPTRPGPTMTTACINPSKGRFLHPTEHHGITVRHAARFQTFPETFIFHGGLMASGTQVGNAVPIRLGVAVLKTITQALQDA
ncbi:DNA cytosine methyltransferase [Pseudodesulfovibrio thermohalotolerans]|uniref:DNA cytosine methyltransferase n=1 Tax=Pseudodesulfovibrio thermohalotolerans TaxID=2880651 RepID=UPI0024411D05|nr:DNA cytosine methyltransferase [Pseudodesulfovibrio thermohalotolerans]WFS61876.1 DNA cytosine methyltransferase [Pseudodesulfovibrio thermohalotolerans]